GYRNRKPIAVVYMEHHVNVRTAITDVDRSFRRRPKCPLKFLDHCHLTVTCRHATDRSHFARIRVVVEFGSEDMVSGNDASQRRLNQFLRRRRNDEERKPIAVEPPVEEVHQHWDVTAQAYALPRFHQVPLSNAAKLRIVANQVREFATLLNKTDGGKPLNLFPKIRNAYQVAEYLTRIVEAQGLVKV